MTSFNTKKNWTLTNEVLKYLQTENQISGEDGYEATDDDAVDLWDKELILSVIKGQFVSTPEELLEDFPYLGAIVNPRDKRSVSLVDWKYVCFWANLHLKLIGIKNRLQRIQDEVSETLIPQTEDLQLIC